MIQFQYLYPERINKENDNINDLFAAVYVTFLDQSAINITTTIPNDLININFIKLNWKFELYYCDHKHIGAVAMADITNRHNNNNNNNNHNIEHNQQLHSSDSPAHNHVNYTFLPPPTTPTTVNISTHSSSIGTPFTPITCYNPDQKLLSTISIQQLLPF
jgi:hypothetical protein